MIQNIHDIPPKVQLIVYKYIQKIRHSDIGSRIASGAFWSFTGTAIAKLMVLIGGILCAHILGKEAYGEFGMVRSTISLFVVLGTAGVGLTATKYIAEYRNSDKEHIASIYLLTNGFAVCTGLLVTLIILLSSSFLAETTLQTPHLVYSIRWGAILLFFTVMNGAQTGTLAGFENFKGIAINNFIGSFFETICMLIGAYKYGVDGAVVGFGMGFVVLNIVNYIAIRQTFQNNNIRISWQLYRRSDTKLLYLFSLPAALSSLMVTPVFWIVRSMLVRHSGYGELALYEAADQWKIIILFIPGAVSQIVLPILSSIVNSNQDAFWRVLKINILLNVIITSIVSIFVCVASPFIISMYGNGFDNPMPLIYLGLSTIFTSLSTVVGLSISSRSKMWTGFSFNFLWGIMTVSFSYFFINMNYGASGIALAILFAYFFHTIFQLVYLYIIKTNDKNTIRI